MSVCKLCDGTGLAVASQTLVDENDPGVTLDGHTTSWPCPACGLRTAEARPCGFCPQCNAGNESVCQRRERANPVVTHVYEIHEEDDGRWIADYLGLPGVMAYGATPQAALEAAIMLRSRVETERDAPAETPTPSVDCAHTETLAVRYESISSGGHFTCGKWCAACGALRRDEDQPYPRTEDVWRRPERRIEVTPHAAKEEIHDWRAVAVAAEAHRRYDQPSSAAALDHAIEAWRRSSPSGCNGT